MLSMGRKKYSEEQVSQWVVMYEAGKSLGEIGQSFGVPKATIAWTLKQLGLGDGRSVGRKPKYANMTSDQVAEAKANARAGKPCVECGRSDVEFYSSNLYQCVGCVKDKAGRYYQEHSDQVKARRRESYDPIEARNASLKYLYNLTPDQHETMVMAQGGLCALCGQPPRGRSRNDKVLHVDHDHETGRVRRLLCMTCNRALGLFRDDPVLLERAANYVRQHREAA